MSNSVGDSRKVVIHRLREIHIFKGHTWTERGKCTACWSGFPL
jgi:hypothetical protein